MVGACMGRGHMFACRLSDCEYEALERLLALSDVHGLELSISDKFRFILMELSGRLKRDDLKHLDYVRPKTELRTYFR
jgi:hypothetical protein